MLGIDFQRMVNGFYEVDELGYKYNLTDVAASIGLQQLPEIDSNNKKREKIAKSYDQFFDQIPSIDRFHYSNKYKHAYHLYIINIKEKQWRISRNELIDKINDKGIGTSVHYVPLHIMPYYKKKYGHSGDDFPDSSNYYKTCISLPIYPQLKKAEISYIKNIILRLSEKYQK